MKKAQNILNKITSSIMTIILVGTTFAPVVSYATNQMAQDENEGENNVIFDVTVDSEHPDTNIPEDAVANNETTNTEIITDNETSNAEGVTDNEASNAEVTTNNETSNAETVTNNETTNAEMATNNETSNAEVAINNEVSNTEIVTNNETSNIDIAINNETPNIDMATNNEIINIDRAENNETLNTETVESNETSNVDGLEGNETVNTETQGNNDTADETHSYIASLETKLKLKFSIVVNGEGYIKNGIISINGNNYKIGEINENLDDNNANNIHQANAGSIEIGQVNDEKPLNFELPIEFEKQDLMDEEYFDKNSTVKLEANFINDDGTEEYISKEIIIHLKWEEEAEGYVNQELRRYLKYENKTLVSFLVTNGIKDNRLPQLEKITQILVPKIADQEPSKIIVSGDVADYAYQNQILMITDPSGFSWDSSSEYLVTYIYDSQMEEGTLSSAMMMQAKSVNEKIIEVVTDEMTYAVKDKVGNLLETRIEGVDELSKGYLYTNLNREDKLDTAFGQVYQMNIGLTDFLDDIEISENESNIVTKKVMVNRDELTKILGEDGSIKVLDEDNIELGTINKDNLELDVNNNSLRYVTSKPVQEGNLNLYINKIIDPNMEYTKESLGNLNELEVTLDVMGIYQGDAISNNHIVNKINLTEPSSNATVSINQGELATVGKNEDVVITATLETNDISDALYTNPELVLTLPSQITNIELKDVKLLYEDELVPVDFKVEGTQIYFRLDGTQTKYSSIPTANGTVIQVIADLTLDNLAVNADERIILDYANPARNEIKRVETPVKIVAPTGFVVANYATQVKTVTAIEKDEIFETPANDIARQITLRGTIVSNSDKSTTGLSILGRVPGEGTKSVDGVNNDLASTYTTNMMGPIILENIDADVYYSENGDANYDLGSATNGWTQEFNPNVKSYLIVARSDIAPSQRISFIYDIQVPSGIDYAHNAFSTFAVYYDNDEVGQTAKNIIVSKKINIETENVPIIRAQITASDYYSGNPINYGDNVNQGSYIRYRISVTNNGGKPAEKVEIKVPRPEGTEFIGFNYEDVTGSYEMYYDESDQIVKTIDKLNPGETQEVEMVLHITSLEINSNLVLRPEITAENVLDSSMGIYENKIVDGTLILKLDTTYGKNEEKINEEISYNLGMENTKNVSLTNVSIRINIPDNMEIVDSGDGEYDKNTRQLKFNINELTWETVSTFKTRVTYTNEPNEEIGLTAIGTFDGAEKDVNSQTKVISVIDTNGFDAVLESNINGRMLDTDTVEYYITVNNNSKKEAEVEIYDTLPKELKIEKYIVKNGSEIREENASISPNIEENVKAGESVKVTIRAIPYRLNKVGDMKDIENNAIIRINGLDLETGGIKQQIEGSSNFNTEITEETIEEVEDKYSISGEVWHDTDENSKQDNNENGINKVALKLYNLKNNEYLKDENGNDVQVETNENGEYIFNNLTEGSYIVVSNYDDSKYVLGHYQLKNLSQNENNDFIETEKGEATTNNLEIKGKNIYNVDLGLTDVKNFNITVESKIEKMNVITGERSKIYEGEEVNKIEVNQAHKEDTTIVITYDIEVKNEGNVDGYAKEITNQIPKGMKFISELNTDWYLTPDGNAINTKLANKIIRVGEKEELKLILSKELDAREIELIHNTTEVKETYNERGIKETNAKSGRTILGGGIADIVIKGKNVAKEVAITITLSLGIIVILSRLGAVVYRKANRA